MKKFEIFVKLFIVLLVIFCFESYFKGEIIQKTFMEINEYYHLESGPNPFYSVFICESKGNLDCFVVEEISNQDKNYLIGKMENNQYFYINYSETLSDTYALVHEVTHKFSQPKNQNSTIKSFFGEASSIIMEFLMQDYLGVLVSVSLMFG